MKAIRGGFAVLSCMIFLSLSYAASAEQKSVSHDTEIDGTKIHYTTTGHGPAVILLHGYAETSRMWTPIFPLLAEKYSDCARPAGDWRFSDSGDRVGHDDRGQADSCAGKVAGSDQSASGRPRHRIDGGVRLRRAISGGDGEISVDGRFFAGGGWLGTDLQQSAVLAFPISWTNP